MIPIITTYRARPGCDTPLRKLLEDHWPTLYRLGLVTDTPAVVLRDPKDPCRFVEYFEWANEDSLSRAHTSTDVQKIWGQFRELTDMGGVQPAHYRFVGKRPNVVRIVLPVTDLDRAVHFYTQTLGLSVLHRQDPDLVHLSTRGVTVVLQSGAKRPDDAHPTPPLVFWRDSVSGRRAELEAKGVRFAGAVREVARGHFYTEFADPDGNALGLEGCK